MSARLLIEQAEELDRATTRDWCDDFDMVGTRDKINGNVVCVAPGEELGGSRALWPVNKRFIVAARSLVPALAAELKRLTEWHPIAEAPRDGNTLIIGGWFSDGNLESIDLLSWCDMDDGEHPERKFWINMAGQHADEPTHFRYLAE